MKPIIIIPSRLGSTRLPGKALKSIHGEPMIVHVWRRGIEAKLGPVIVAAGDPEIVAAIELRGGDAVLTDPNLPSGSDRSHAAMEIVDRVGFHDLVIVLQGDLPTIDPVAIQATLTPLLENASCDIGSLATVVKSDEELRSPSVVKIALSIRPNEKVGRAVYFSRQPIHSGDGPHFHHVGMYSYRREALGQFVTLRRGILEKRESLEQLRALEAGMRIDVSLIDTEPLGVDTAEDLEQARSILSKKLKGG